jgi:predicted TIM-barrel fold metal-dependent hydrolase
VSSTLEIIDAQVHLNQLVPNWQTAPADSVISTGIQAMDAVGIDRVLIGEARGFAANAEPQGQVLPNGAVRTDYPFSERAVQLHPDRFIYHVRIDYRDPDVDSLAGQVAGRPGARSIRIVPVPQTGEVASLQRGDFEPLFAAAERHQVPVFAWMPGRVSLLEPYIRKFPKLQFIVDHCGVGIAPIRIGTLPPTVATSVTPLLADRVMQLEHVCEMAQYPNVALKWSHAPGLLSAEEYPYRDVLPLLRKAINAFSVERLLWASDYTVARDRNGNSWGECLYYLLDTDELTRTEKEWVLGGTLRKVLDWPRL